MGSSADRIAIGIDLRTTPTDADQQVARLTMLLGQFREQAAALGADQGGAAQGAQQLATQVNSMIGAFQTLARITDAANAKAVAGFRAAGDALSVELAKLGATEQEINKVGAAVASLEELAGAAAVLERLNPPNFGPTLQGNAFAIRRGADALSTLAFAATTGAGSMQTLTFSAGSVTTALLSLSGTSLGLATGIGGLVTVGVALVDMLTRTAAEAKSAKKALDDLTGIDLSSLERRITDTDQLIHALTKKRDALASGPSTGPVIVHGATLTPPDTKSTQEQIDAINKQLDELAARRTALTDAILKAGPAAEKAITDQAIKGENDALVAHVRRIQGEAEADRTAAQQRADEREKEIREQETAAKQLGLNTDAFERALTANRAQFTTEIETINAKERDRLAAQQADRDIARAKSTAQVAADAARATEAHAEAVNDAVRKQRQETERAFIDEKLRLELNAINAEKVAQLQAIDAEVAARTKQLAGTTDLEARRTIADDLAKLGDQRAKAVSDASAKEVKARADANQQTAALDRQLADAVAAATQETLRAQGNLVEAASRELHKQFDDQIAEAKAAGDIVKANALEQAIDVGIQRAQVTELEQAVSQASALAQARLADIKAQAKSGTIGSADAARTTVAALRDEQATLERVIPLLAQQAALLGDQATLAKVEQLRAELAGVTDEIDALSRKSDEFALLFRKGMKDAAGALEESLALGLQESTDGVHKFSDAWRDAAGSIIAALQRIAAQMLATLIIQKSLQFLGGLLGGSGGSSLGSNLTSGGLTGVAHGATGGLVRGPGTSTSDSVPAMLSTGEFVLNAAVVKQLGADWLSAINTGWASLRQYADGGLVSASVMPSRPGELSPTFGFIPDTAPTIGSGPGIGGDGTTRIVLEHSEDTIIRVMESHRGAQVILRKLQQNRNAANHALGSR